MQTLGARRASYTTCSHTRGHAAHGNYVHPHPETLYPLDGYSLLEVGLHRATTSIETVHFPFLAKLKLRTAMNLSAEPLHHNVLEYLQSIGVTLLAPRSLEALDGPYDLWEEAVKEGLELVLDANNHPMILLDSPSECEAACLVGCLRRLQCWSVCAIHDEYRILTMRNSSYDANQRFMERFDTQLVNFGENLPSWFRDHLAMLREEQTAGEKLLANNYESTIASWSRGLRVKKTVSDKETENEPKTDIGPEEARTAGDTKGDQGWLSHEEDNLDRTSDGVGNRRKASCDAEVHASYRSADEAAETDSPATQHQSARLSSKVPEYRLNGFVYVCPLVSENSTFTPKMWLQDEDDG